MSLVSFCIHGWMIVPVVIDPTAIQKIMSRGYLVKFKARPRSLGNLHHTVLDFHGDLDTTVPFPLLQSYFVGSTLRQLV